MKLRKWLQDHDHTQAWLADVIGVSQPYINGLISGSKLPSLKTLTRIHRLTRGDVSVLDFEIGDDWWPPSAVLD